MAYGSFYNFYLEPGKCHEGSIPGAVSALWPTEGEGVSCGVCKPFKIKVQ